MAEYTITWEIGWEADTPEKAVTAIQRMLTGEPVPADGWTYRVAEYGSAKLKSFIAGPNNTVARI